MDDMPDPIIRLTPEEAKRFIEACDNPPEPSDQMKAAVARYRALFGR